MSDSVVCITITRRSVYKAYTRRLQSPLMYFHSFLKMDASGSLLSLSDDDRSCGRSVMDVGKNQSGTDVTRIPTATRM